jgi:hypothetical protein
VHRATSPKVSLELISGLIKTLPMATFATIRDPAALGVAHRGWFGARIFSVARVATQPPK